MKSDNSVKGISGSSGNSSLGREEHVRQVSPDRHQLKIGTWNVQTMMQKGNLKNVKQEMKMMKTNILGLSDGYKVMYSGGEHHYRGVGVIHDPETSKAIKGFWIVSDKAIILKLQGKPLDIGLIQIYAPTADKEEEEVEVFYETVKEAMKQLKSQGIEIVIGDFNSNVGSERAENVLGPFGMGEKNERGDRLLEFCKEHKFTIMNTRFKNHPRRWT